MTPRCYNRAPCADGDWLRVGYRGTRVVFRWFPRWFVDRCATWDGRGIGANGEAFPAAHGFECVGCRWLPVEHASDAALTEARVRHGN